MKHLLYLLMPLLAQAQTDTKKVTTGIQWAIGMNWQQVVAKAKSEHKLIFVDAYATWCGPCKMMDKNIYNTEQVGALFNKEFVSVKVQFDKTGKDDEFVRNWYAVADELNRKYQVSAFPTFLFFSGDGNIVHQDFGYKSVQQFVELGQSVLDPKKQVYRLLDEYMEGKRDLDAMKLLAIQCKKLMKKEDLAMQIAEEYLSLADSNSLLGKDGFLFMADFKKSAIVKKILQDYKSNKLDQLSDSSLYTKDNFDFISKFSFLVNSKDKFFYLFYNNPKMADSIIQISKFSDKIVRNVILKEEIYPFTYSENFNPITKKVNWKKIKSTISKRYNKDYAESLVTQVQPLFYERVRDWRNYVKFFEKKIKKNTPKVNGKALGELGDAWALNSAAWTLFEICDNQKVLRKALDWVEISIKLDSMKNGTPTPQILDTRANILYKLGRITEAIDQQEKVIEADNNMAKKASMEKSPYRDTFLQALNRMKQGRPTWPEKEKNR